MPAKKTRVADLPTDKAIRKLFPAAVVKKAKEVAHAGNKRKSVKSK